MHHCYDLSGLTLPEDSPELRDHVLPESRRTGDYMARYDRRTLIYDLAEAPGGEGWVMTCPRLFNLAPLLDQALPDAQIPPWYRRRRQTLRTSDLRFLRGGAGPLRLRLHGQDHEVAVRPDISAAFAGRNVLMCINKDNDLAWITDWARFHARAHGVNAVVIFDNASTCYAPQSLAARLDGLEGIDQVAVLSARYPYGPAVNAIAGNRQNSCKMPCSTWRG